MPFVMKENEAFDPIDIGSFSANAVMFQANGVSYKIEEFRLVVLCVSYRIIAKIFRIIPKKSR